MVSWSFLVEFFGSLRYRIISSANRDILTVSLPIYIPCISSSCLSALDRNSSTMLNKSGYSGHPCLIPDFRGHFQISIFYLYKRKIRILLLTDCLHWKNDYIVVSFIFIFTCQILYLFLHNTQL
jgi:hypothetical protein